MSIIKSIKQVLGLGPAAENHHWDGSVPNQLSLLRGTPEAPGTEVLKVVNGELQPVQTGPAFSAYPNAPQSAATSGFEKTLFQVEEFDTANCFSNSRFTPNVAGYYQIDATVLATNTEIQQGIIALFKNGAVYKRGTMMFLPPGSGLAALAITVSCLVYLNGTTDYVELNTAWNPAGTPITITSHQTYFQGFLARKV